MNGNWATFYRKTGEKVSLRVSHTYLSRQTSYQYVEIVETETFGKALLIDGCMMSAIDDTFVYHESLVHPAMCLTEQPKNVFICGGGEGQTVHEILKHPSVEHITMVDIDAELIDIAKVHLQEWHHGALFDKRLTIIHDDARKVLAQSTEQYDVILGDLTTPSPDNPSLYCFTHEFYKIVQDHLKEGGVFASQSNTINCNNLEFLPIIHHTLKSVFKDVYSYGANIASDGDYWSWTLAGDSLGSVLDFNPDEALQQRQIKDLQLYDSVGHKGMFNLPKYVRKALAEYMGPTSKDATPLSTPEIIRD